MIFPPTPIEISDNGKQATVTAYYNNDELNIATIGSGINSLDASAAEKGLIITSGNYKTGIIGTEHDDYIKSGTASGDALLGGNGNILVQGGASKHIEIVNSSGTYFKYRN